jgi:hypothetical protein
MKEALILLHTDDCRLFKMEKAPNNINTLASLMRMSFSRSFMASPPAPCSIANVSIALRTASSLTTVRCYPRPWPTYDSKNDKRNFTSVTGERPDLSFLPFPNDKVAILDCCNGLVLCLCVETARSRYVIYNSATKNLRVLPPSIHAVGQARLGFDPTVSSYFHVIELVEEDAECLGVEIYSS